MLIGIGVLVGDVLAAATVAPFRHGLDLGVLRQARRRFGGGHMLYPRLDAADVVRS